MRADPPRLEQPAGQRRLVGGQAEALGQRLEGGALDQGRGDDDEEDDREQLLAGADPGDDREGREPDRRRAAQAGPAEHRPLADVERGEQRRREGGQRAGDEDQDRRERQALERDVAERAGEDEQAEQDEEADLGDPAEPLVEGDDRPPGRDPGRRRAPARSGRWRAGRSRGRPRPARRRGRRSRSSPPGRSRRSAAARGRARRPRAGRARARRRPRSPV